jgi:hypothetical protein
MHHLFPARANVNEARLNYPFAEVDDNRTRRWFIGNREQGNIPSVNIDAYSELGDQEFEPREDHKGNVARAIFYFYTVYRSVADASFFSGQRETLCEWHYADPVDSSEWLINSRIASFQDGKRNPFILDCSLAERSYCPDVVANCQTTLAHNMGAEVIDIRPNPADDVIFIRWSNTPTFSAVLISSVFGVEMMRVPVETGGAIDISQLPGGMYIVSLVTENQNVITSQRLIKR